MYKRASVVKSIILNIQ